MSTTETLTRDPVITARIRACKTVIKREAAAQAGRRAILALPHGPSASELMVSRFNHRILISALLDTCAVLRGKPASHLRPDEWRAGIKLAAAGKLIDAQVLLGACIEAQRLAPAGQG
jgi:hypothetical protein